MNSLPVPPAAPSVLKRRRRAPRGQAMIEYSIINWVLVLALVLVSSVHMIPGPPGPDGIVRNRNVIEMFLEAYQHYYNSFYFVLNLPFP